MHSNGSSGCPALSFSSCDPLYFKSAALPDSPVRYSTLADLHFRELWSGFVFNGEKVGFTAGRFRAVQTGTVGNMSVPHTTIDTRFVLHYNFVHEKCNHYS